jgi:hypothetical protein
MNRRKLLALLIVVGLLSGLIGRVPVALAQHTIAMSPNWFKSNATDGTLMFSSSNTQNQIYSSTCTATIAGVSCNDVQVIYENSPTQTIFGLYLQCSALANSSKWGDGNFYTVAWSSGTTAIGNSTIPAGSFITRLAAGIVATYMDAADYGWYGGALTVTVDGDAAPLIQVSKTYTATISGGAAPYNRRWRVWRDGSIYYTGSWGAPGATFDYTFQDIHAYQVECEVLDAYYPTEDVIGYKNVQPYVATLTCTVAGTNTAAVGVAYTFTATIGGGLTPYHTTWQVNDLVRVVWQGTYGTATTMTYTFGSVKHYQVWCTVVDALGTSVTGTHDVNGAADKPIMWGQVRDLDYNDPVTTKTLSWIEFKMFPNSVPKTSPPVSGGEIATGNYEITSPATSAQAVTYYILRPIAWASLPNPLIVYVNYHDPASGQDWSYSFSFDTTGWAANGWALSNGDTGATAETPVGFAWLWDMLVKLFKALFVPSSSAFSDQLASGWVLIDSPVPSIIPQYTIPFPNPNHLLAPTGDSVDISFAGIQSYSGYSTYRAIVQAVLDMVLLFVVISLVT